MTSADCLCDQVAIEVSDVNVFYGRKQALHGVTTHIPPCAITALIGPSGCGKTSFLSSLNRMLDTIDGCRVEGVIRIGDNDIHDPQCNLRLLRQHVGMIFQKPNPFPLSIRKNITLPLLDRGGYSKVDIEEIIESSLTRVGLWHEVKDRLDTSALSLSGGQQQRLCIARTLALQPQVILFDEPCSALDPLASAVVEDLIKELGVQYTVVIVTHNMAQARRIADKVCFFWLDTDPQKGATIIEQGSAEDIFTNPQNPLTTAYVTGGRG